MASDVTLSWVKQKYIGGDGSGWLRILKAELVADTDGSFTDYVISAGEYETSIRFLKLKECYVVPGTPTPTDATTIKICKPTHGDADIFESQMIGVSNSDAARFCPPTLPAFMWGGLKIQWTGNSVNGAKFDIYMYFE